MPVTPPDYAVADGTDAILRIRVIPRAARDGLGGQRGDALVVRLAAPPVDDAANRALVRYLSECLDVAVGRVSLLTGERARAKRVRVSGLTPAQVAERLAPQTGATRASD